ncbi:hypothetical protein DJ73_10095 [Halorubrum sp. Ea1]|nr:hypothetical protein DJ73_10095 [Halorubrum sp. Ea1]
MASTPTSLSDSAALLRTTAETLLQRTVFDPPAGERLTRPLYWAVAPAIFERLSPTDFVDRAAAPKQFKIERVDPGQIRRFTPRVYPAWHDRVASFGRVESGCWDRRPYDETPSHGGPPMDLYYADRIEEGLLYRAIESHFVDDVPWEQTRFVQRVIEYLEYGRQNVWQGCSSREDVFARCRRVEEIYRSMRRRGCLSYRELMPPSRREEGFLRFMENEIVVDIGRGGELLLVSGKHRYSIARALELDEIP